MAPSVNKVPRSPFNSFKMYSNMLWYNRGFWFQYFIVKQWFNAVKSGVTAVFTGIICDIIEAFDYNI